MAKATKKRPATRARKKVSPGGVPGGLNKHERELLQQLHKDLQPKALEMRDDEIAELSGETANRWKWGKYVDEAFDEKKYGENQVETLAEFLGKRPEALWEVRKFYRTYGSENQLGQVLKIRKADGRPLPWTVIVEVLRKDLKDSERKSWLEKAARNDWDYRTLRKEILAKVAPKDERERGTTPKKALRSAEKQATKFQDSSEEFDETLEEKLLKGNADDFTDDVMRQLETTRTSLLEMRGTIELHLGLVDECLARGRRLRGEAGEAADEEAEEVVVTTTTEAEPEAAAEPRRIRKKVPTKKAVRATSRRKRPTQPLATTEGADDDSLPSADVSPRPVKKKRPSPGSPQDKIARARKKSRRPEPATA